MFVVSSISTWAENDALTPYVSALEWPADAPVMMIAFSEERQFPFRKFPKRFAGTMYRSPKGELAICYNSPRAMRILLNKDEILIERDGRLSPLPASSVDAGAMYDLLDGNLEMLRANWQPEARDDGFRLRPKADSLRDAVKWIDVSIVDNQVRSVAVHQSNQAIRRYEFADSRPADLAGWDPFSR